MMTNHKNANANVLGRKSAWLCRHSFIWFITPLLITLAGCPLGDRCSSKEETLYSLLQQCAACGGSSGLVDLEDQYPSCGAMSEDLQTGYQQLCDGYEVIDQDCPSYETYLDLAIDILELCEIGCP